MRLHIADTFELHGVRYRAGEVHDFSETIARDLVRQRVARIDAAELLRHLRGKRMTTTTCAVQITMHRG